MKRAEQTGFTIVELLIVIVVIGILAAITIVAFNGVQTKAKVATVQNDLRNISTQMNLFKAENGHYPSASQVPRSDLAQILKDANIYSSTRATSADWNNGIYPSRRFVFCSPNDDGDTYAVVAAAPLLPTSPPTSGIQTYFIDQTGVVQSMISSVDPTLGEAAGLCMKATNITAANWNINWAVWSNSVPTSWAP